MTLLDCVKPRRDDKEKAAKLYRNHSIQLQSPLTEGIIYYRIIPTAIL